MALRRKCNGAKLVTEATEFGRPSSDVGRQEETMPGYKSLDVYKRSYKLAKDIHHLTQSFPSIEKYELGSQLRRAAISITLNIAEGYGRKDSRREFQHFLRNALGSCNEVRVLIEFCKDLGYMEENMYRWLDEQYEIVGRQLYRLREVNKS